MWKKWWIWVNLRRPLYSDVNRRLDRLYLVKDPWGMDSQREQFRFEQTSKIIQHSFGHLSRLLEIGCGEGHQSQFLSRICETLYGIDVSRRAVARAVKRCPKGKFSVDNLFADDLAVEQFDLVVACEVLMFMRDIPAALKRMNELGKGCLVTYYYAYKENLDSYLAEIPNTQSEKIVYEETQWRAVWWRSQ